MKTVMFFIALVMSMAANASDWNCHYGNVQSKIGNKAVATTYGLNCVSQEGNVQSIATFGDHRDEPDQVAAAQRLSMLMSIAICDPLNDSNCTVVVEGRNVVMMAQEVQLTKKQMRKLARQQQIATID